MRSFLRHVTAPVALAALLGGCSNSSSSNTNAQTMTKVAGDNQSATVRTAVPISPAVKITDQSGAAVSGIVVTFTVTGGGGNFVPETSTTGTDGIATMPGVWILGATAGTNTLTATASGVAGSPATFTATGTALVPAPTFVGKAAGTDNQTYPAGSAVSVLPGVIVRDQTNTPIAGVTVTFAVASGGGSITGAVATTDGLGIATVGSWTLGSAAGANTLTATVSGYSGAALTFTETGIAAFSPTSNTTLSGTQLVGSVNIPAGVTVTMTADVTLNVIGDVTIAGTLIGDCKNLTISSGGVFRSSGNINNGCTVPTATPTGILIVATGGYHVTAGTFTLSGLLNLTNDAGLSDATFPAPPAGLKAAASSAALRQAGVCSVGAATFTASPATALQGADGNPAGARGTDGATWVLQCTGELDINGGVGVTGQSGGAGGAGTNSSATAASATGGQGGFGGTIKVRANNGNLVVSGFNNSITSGSGGAGGAATATGTGQGNPGASATSAGGNGAAPGTIVMQAAGGGIDMTTGTVNLIVGAGGNGGAATSVGGLGQTAAPCNAGVGGFATATGGTGGSTPDKTLKATGTVGGIANVTVSGGNPGSGGKGTATGGNGGGGAQACPNGGAGGATTATGGQGGNSLLKNAAGALFANGGQGGAMEVLAGKGGLGWNGCSATPNPLPGGTGGAGGAVGGKNGAGGTGLQNGAPGAALMTTVADGGNGGNGFGPGDGGPGGASNANITVVANTVQPSFNAGTPGQWCAVQKAATLTVQDDPSNHDAVLQLAGPRATTQFSSTGAWTGLFPNAPAQALNCTFNATTLAVTCTASGITYAARTITSAVFTGTVSNGQISGTLDLTISGQANHVKYAIIDP